MSKRLRTGEDLDDKTAKRIRRSASQVEKSSSSSTSEQPTPEPYRYRPLRKGDIRVLVLSPGKDDEPLRGTLRRTKLGADGIRYEAISYVWGEPVFPHPLCVDGKVIYITESLFTALREFRYDDKERTLWADAVCINQADFEERAAQVAMIGRIFNDSRVLIWLGPAQPEDQLAFATINALGNFVEWKCETFNGDQFEKTMNTLRGQLVDLHEDGHFESYLGMQVDLAISGIIAGALLLNRSWFFRVWVVQEARSYDFDPTICSGQHRALFRPLFWLLDLFESTMTRNQGRMPSASTDNVLVMLQKLGLEQGLFSSWYESFNPYAAMDMVVRSGQRDCADPRDRVFSIYDVQHLCEMQSLKVDYTRSTWEVYLDFTLGCLGHGEGTFRRFPVSRLLSMAGTTSRESQDHDWPTWLPDFHRLTIRSCRKLDYYSSLTNWPYYNFPCENRSTPDECRECHGLNSHSVIRDQKILKTRGKIFGRVKKIAVDVDWPRIRSNGGFDFAELAAWYMKVRILLYDVLDFEGNSCELLRLLSCGISEEGFQDVYMRMGVSKAYILQSANELRNVIEKAWHDPCSHSSKVISIENFLEMCSHPTAGCVDIDRHLCVFEVGGRWDFGWVPQSAQPGDELCLVSAGEHPFLLRRRTDGRYGILGDAWVLNTSLRQALNGGHPVEHERKFSVHAPTAAQGHECPRCALLRHISDSATTETETEANTEESMSDSLVDDTAPMEVEDALNENSWCNAHREVPWLLEGMDEIELR